MYRPLVFVDCEAFGGCPRTGALTEFGAVDYYTRKTFHGIILESHPDPKNPAIPVPSGKIVREAKLVFLDFEQYLKNLGNNPVFISDNVAYDWQWINDGFHVHIGRNPFGFSGRRISDFYAGLTGNFFNTQEWKKFRKTKHDHNPVNDAMGNVEAFGEIMLRYTKGAQNEPS